MAVDKSTLKNGIRIVSKEMPHARSVSMGVWVNVGARDESELESGLSHFIEHMIFKGTRKRSAFQIAKEFDAIGGHTNAFTAMENTCYHARVMDTQTETMVDILSDIFINSVFDPAEVDKERPVILQEIGMIEDLTKEPEVGTIYEGTVVKIMDFGAFVQIMPGTDGLVHISQLAHHRVTRVSDIVKEGDKLKVKVLEISRDGKIRLSHKAVLEEEKRSGRR